MPNQSPNFDQARKNMVDCQILPNGVLHEGLIEAFETTPRELFVPENLHGIAYFDEEIDLGKGRKLLDPLTLSKMLQAAELKESDIVLDIAGATGYGAAIIAPNVSTVIAIEGNEEHLKVAEKSWADLDVCNVVPIHAKPKVGAADKGPYDLIVMHGAVPEIPTNIAAQMTENGRMLCIIKGASDKIGKATLVQAIGENQFSSYTLFECGADYIEGFAPKPAFSF